MYPEIYNVNEIESLFWDSIYDVDIGFFSDDINGDVLVFRIEDNTKNLDLVSWYNELPSRPKEFCNSLACVKWTKIKIGLYDGLLIDQADPDHGQSFNIYLADKTRGNIISLLSVSPPGLSPSYEEMKKILDSLKLFEPN